MLQKPILINTILFLFSIVMIGNSIGCNGDDSGPPGPLVGTWKWTFVENVNCPDPGEEGSQNIYDCAIYCSEIEFNQDGTLKIIVNPDDPALIQKGTYTYSDNSLSWCVGDIRGESCNSGEVTFLKDSFQFLLDDDHPCDVVWHFERK